jgi:hypothetical protein
MKKLLYLILTFTLLSCNDTTGQNTEDSIPVEDRIISSLTESQKKSFFNLILNAQDRATTEATKLVPDNSKFDERIEKERELQEKYELGVFQTQSWWNQIDGDINIAIKIKNKISTLGVISGWL